MRRCVATVMWTALETPHKTQVTNKVVHPEFVPMIPSSAEPTTFALKGTDGVVGLLID